jgi:hypothetical protein
MTRTMLSAIHLLLPLALLGGCGGAGVRTVKFSYQEPPVCEIPDSVGTLAVAEFRQAGGEGWGGVVTQRLAEALRRAELPHRVRIIQGPVGKAASRPAVGPVIVDTPSAVAWGESVGADAVAYGAVVVVSSNPSLPEQPSGRPTGPIQSEMWSCQVTVSLVIDEVQAGRTAASLTVSQRYPPPHGEAPAGPAAPSEEAVVSELVSQCVDRLVGQLCPRTVWVNEQLQFGRTRLVLDGNVLARAGQFEKALDCYLRGMDLSSGDDGAVFNAGLMYEALGQLATAREFYERAAAMRPGEYIDQALRRLDRRAGRE